MERKELDKILKEHKKWQNGEGGQGADLQRADLQGANLQRAYLQGANLQRAYLQDANLQRADLRDTLLDGIDWLAYIGIAPNEKGIALAYKLTKQNGQGIYRGGIDYIVKDKFSVPEVDPDLYTQCSYGINLATFSWCLSNKQDETNRLFLFKFNVKDAVCPIASDGKFRVKKCTKIGECTWKGRLKDD